LDLLLPGCDFREVARELAACVPEVDLKNERVRQTLAGHARVRHKPLKRRIRDEAAIPIVFALNLDCGETGRQRAARHHMLGSDHLRPGVEIDQVAAAHIHRAEAETRVMLFRVYTVEVDEALKRRSQRPRVIVARRLDGTGRMKPRIGDSRPEEARRSGGGNRDCAHLIGERTPSFATSKETDEVRVEAHGRGGDFLPELAQSVGSSFGRIAGDDGGVDGTDRNADDPVGMKLGLGQGFIDARLVGAERPAPLQ